MGKKEKIMFNFSLLGFLLSKSTWMCNKKPIPFPSAYTGTKYLVANRWSTGRLGCECFSFSSLSLCGPKSVIKCYLFLFSLFLPSLWANFLLCWLEVTARKQGLPGLCLNHQFRVLPLAHLHWPIWGWSLGPEQEALRAYSSFYLQAAKIFLGFSYFCKQWSFSPLCCSCNFIYDWK